MFHLQPHNALINDSNNELINVCMVIKDFPEELISDLKRHCNEADYFYRIRALDRTDDFDHLTPVPRASRLIYLNKTCYNGLYRLNKVGNFNAPFGRYKKSNIVNEAKIMVVNRFLNSHNIVIKNKD